VKTVNDELVEAIRNSSDIKRLRVMQATVENSPWIRKQIARIRVAALKKIAASQKHDLSSEEIAWMGELLEKRIGNSFSVAEMQKSLENDCASDFGLLQVDVNKVRKQYDRTESLVNQRYSNSMADRVRKPTADEYISGVMSQDNVPDVNLEGIE